MDILTSHSNQEQAERPRVLVVDDEDNVLEALKAVLGEKFEVFTSASPRRALQILEDTPCDILVTDLSMPEMDGFELIKEARKIQHELRAIIITGHATKSNVMEAIKEDASDLLEKPFNSEILVHTVEKTYATMRADKLAAESVHLREMNEAKSQFVADASHELRTPLAIIREYVSLVCDEVAGPVNEKQKECLQSAVRNCDRLSELINKMLDLAKIESGKIELNRVKTDIAPLLKECHHDFSQACSSRNQELMLDVANDLPSVNCDRDSVRQIVTNLLGNAQKFTPEGGTIRLGCIQQGQYLCISIADDGAGIPAEAQEKIFAAFAQVGREFGPGAKGTGLGLTISRRLVELNRGCIILKSDPGEGSCFSFTLPVYDQSPSHRVLVVDDEELAIRTITGFLRSTDLSLDVKSVSDGLESLVLAGQFRPELVILDIHMPDVDGTKILASLRRGTPEHTCKILSVSGDADALSGIVEQGADDYLLKPFSAQELIRKVVSLLGIDRRKR